MVNMGMMISFDRCGIYIYMYIRPNKTKKVIYVSISMYMYVMCIYVYTYIIEIFNVEHCHYVRHNFN